MSLFIGQRGNNSSFHIWKCRVCTLLASHTAHITNVQTTTNTCWLLSGTLNQWIHAETLMCWRWAVWWTWVLDACAWVPVTETGFVWLSGQSWDICVFAAAQSVQFISPAGVKRPVLAAAQVSHMQSPSQTSALYWACQVQELYWPLNAQVMTVM